MAAAVLSNRDFHTDDAFITFTYAQNLLDGHGLVFHPGEYVLGTTSPAYAVLLAAGGALAPTIPIAALFLGWLSFAVLGLGLYLIFETVHRGGGFLGLIAFALIVTALKSREAFGMESTLTVGVGLLIVWLHTVGRWPVILGALSALALLLRPDMIFLLGVVGLSTLLKREFPWRAALVFAAILGLWVLFAWLQYGSPIPNSLRVKWAIGQIPNRGDIFLESFVTEQYRDHWSRHGMLWIALAGLIGGALVPHRAVTVIVAWVTLQTIAYAVSSTDAHPWYYVPLHCMLCLGLALPAALVASLVNRRWLDALLRLAVFAVCVHTLLFAIRSNPPGPEGRSWGEVANRNVHTYHETAEFLNAHSLPEHTVVTSEVGLLGFLTQNRLIDTVGLVTPEALPHVARGDFGWWMRLDPLPDFLVLHRQFSYEGVDWDFVHAHYHQVLASSYSQIHISRTVAMNDPRLPSEDTEGVTVLQFIDDQPVRGDFPETLEPSTVYITHRGEVLRGTRSLGTFDNSRRDGWQFVGGAMANEPASGARPSQRPLGNFVGDGLINSFIGRNGEIPQGYALSPEFMAGSRDFLVFMVGGGDSPATCVELLSNERVLQRASGRNSEELRWVVWDLRPYENQALWIHVRDASSDSYGHILADCFIIAETVEREP
jgi:hypothetical protein